MHRYARSLVCIAIVLFFVFLLALPVSPVLLGDQNGNLADADTGSGWEEQGLPYTEGEITAISAVDGNTAWASIDIPLVSVDDPIGVLKTENGGSDWFVQDLGELLYGSCVPDIAAVDENTAWTLKWGGAYRTLDGGLTWNVVGRFPMSHGGEFPQHICASGTDMAWFVGILWNITMNFSFWEIAKWSEEGSLWQRFYNEFGDIPAPLSDRGVSSLDMVDDETIWVSFNKYFDQAVALTADGGTSWDIHSYTDMEIIDIYAFNASTAWAVGSKSSVGFGIFKTSDGGATWDVLHIADGHRLSSISAVDAHTAWAVGDFKPPYGSADGGVILKTTDGGITWTTQYEFTGGYLDDVCAVDASTAWVCGKAPDGPP